MSKTRMKNTKSILNMTIVFLMLLNSCTNEPIVAPNGPGIIVPTDIEYPKKKEIIKTEHFRLFSITGICAPHGGYYEYDSKKKNWCERSMMADINAYAHQNNINDIDKIPDLSYYFEKSISNMLNSCMLSIITRKETKIISLRFGGNLLFEDTLALSKTSVKIPKSLNNFLDDIPGSMDLSDGRDFRILINQLALKFSNDFGNYELNFSKIPIKNIAIVMTKKAFFHKEPSAETIEKGYIVRGQNVVIEKSNDTFVLVKFINSKGIVRKGWVLKSDLSIQE